MTTKTRRVYSDLAIPSGETLAEELEVRGMTQEETGSQNGLLAPSHSGNHPVGEVHSDRLGKSAGH